MSYACHERNKLTFKQFETKEWSLEMEDGTKIQLLDSGATDPFKKTNLEED